MSNINRFGSYNILIPRSDLEGEGSGHKWKHRKEAIIEVITQNTDVVGLQECDTDPVFRQSAYVEESLLTQGWDGYLPQHDKTIGFSDEFHHRNPIFWRRSKFGFLAGGVFQLSGFNLAEQFLTPVVENRYCSWVDLVEISSSKSVRVYSLHQQPYTIGTPLVERTMAHRKQYDGLVSLAQHIAQVEGNVVVAGDFNNCVIPGWFYSGSGLVDAWDATPVGTTLNRQFNSFHGWKEPFPQEGSHIDHLLIRSNVTSVSEAKLILSDASDHFLLTADVILS